MSFGGFIRRSIFWTSDFVHNKRVRKHFKEITQVLSDYDRGRLIQEKRLEELLQYACNNSFFYKDYIGKPLSDFPVVNKQILIDNHKQNEVAIDNIPEQETENIHIQRTSGSTGTPFSIPQDSRKRYRRIAELKYFGQSVGFKSHERLAQLRIWTKWQSKGNWQSIKENIFPIDCSKMDDDNLRKICEFCKKKKIQSLRGYASWFERIVDFIIRNPEYQNCFNSVKVAISGSEALDDNTRQQMKLLTGVPIVESYADEECGTLAHQKLGDLNYYWNHASYYLEILKMESDIPAEYGELGRVVVTDLYNYAFPMIRYDTGDSAVLEKGNEKSHGWDYLSKLYGRRLDLIFDTKGNPVHPMNLARILKNFPQIKQWQFIQKAEKEYLLKLNHEKDISFDVIQNELKSFLGSDAVLTIAKVDDIPVLASGKRKPVICEWKRKDNTKQKKVLLLAGAGVHCKVVQAAKELGIYTIVTDNLDVKDAPAKRMADEFLNYDIYDTDKIVEYCKRNNVDGVLGFCIDPTQRPAQEICEKLGLPSFGTKEQVFALTDKNAFKALCEENGVDVITEYSEENLDEIAYPVLVKPVDSRGSRGIVICRNKEELKQSLSVAKKESTNGKCIIEKYMGENQELTITYIVKNGEPNLISIGDRFPGKEADNLNRQNICVIQPSRYSDMYIKNVHQKVIRMIKALGIKNGPVFMQGFADDDTVRMFDPGIRFPGNEYERIYTKATGINPMKSILQYAIGGEIDDYNGSLKDSYLLNGKVAIQYMINVGPGTIGKFDGLEEIAQLPQIVDIQQRHFVGDVIENTGDIKHRAGEICLLCENNIEEIKKCILVIQKKLSVQSTDGKNMLISPFDVQNLELYKNKSY